MNPEQIKQATETITTLWEKWNFLEMPEAQQDAFVQTAIVEKIAQILLTRDAPERIVVLEDLVPAVTRVLLGIKQFPGSVEDVERVVGAEIDREKLDQQFVGICHAVEVHGVSFTQLVMNNPSAVESPDTAFVRFVTSNGLYQATLAHWDQSIGFSRRLGEKGLRIPLSLEDMKLLLLIDHLMECKALSAIAQERNQLIEDPTKLMGLTK